MDIKERKRLEECHPDLERLFTALDQDGIRFRILCGFRGQVEQDAAFEGGKSRVRWPNSKHNVSPSLAVDAAPLPLDWTNIAAFRAFATLVKMYADKLGIPITSGGLDWTSLKDWPHFELPYASTYDIRARVS